MTYRGPHHIVPDPFEHPLDAILADVAVGLQLPPGLHSQTIARYEAVREFIERPGSPLEKKVQCFYPQGSMAIDATISTRGTDDEYDLDIVAQLDISASSPPSHALDLLESALMDYPVKAGIERQTRCITVRYSDGMHLDVTPSSRLPTPNERESTIFHAKLEEPKSAHYRVHMNAFGFCEWYCRRTPMEQRFAFDLAKRYYEASGLHFRAEADVDEVPAQTPLIAKNTATVALQLLKRFRNIQYANYRGRIPPSVKLSYYAAVAAMPNMTLSSMLVHLCRIIARDIEIASIHRRLLEVANPVYPLDKFTDRWPESLDQQNEWRTMVLRLADTIDALKRANNSLEETGKILRGLFGDRVVSLGLRSFNERLGHAVQTGQHRHAAQGRLYVPSAPAIITGASAAPMIGTPARSHTFMGGRLL